MTSAPQKADFPEEKGRSPHDPLRPALIFRRNNVGRCNGYIEIGECRSTDTNNRLVFTGDYQ
jgi:hypothetical protein